MALKLFGLRRLDSKTQEGVYYSDQGVARRERDRLTAINNMQYAVCPGPDHKKYKQWLVEIETAVPEEETS